MLHCSFCSYECKSKSTMSRHVNIQHPERKDDDKICTRCHRVFSSVANCKLHVKKHVCEKLEEVFGAKKVETYVKLAEPEEVAPTLIQQEEIQPIQPISAVDPVISLEEIVEAVTPVTPATSVTQYSWVTSVKTFASLVMVAMAIKYLFRRSRGG